MSLAGRDRDAYDLVARRSFAGAYVASFDLEMQTRRLTLGLYGTLQGGTQTLLGTIRFFGAASLALDNASGEFPERVRLDELRVSYDETADVGSATLSGSAGWSLELQFDGLAYDERPAVLASLADDDG